jgi:hypothetical protein
MRDRRAADRELAGELADRARTFDETLEDRPPRRIAQCGPHIGLVSLH